jgi:ketohexokinase
MTRVICVGIATLDIVNRVREYPPEDSEVRALGQSRRTGGNAANTAMVLAQLGLEVRWLGNLGQPCEIAERDFSRHGVDISDAVRIVGKPMPTSYILLSEATGSRSIVHYRDLPEYRASDFASLDLGGVHWVHFEGRATDQLASMLRRAGDIPGLAVSLEVEKPRPGIENLFGYAGLLLFSRDYARAKGFVEPVALLQSLPPGSVATCTWGASGAWAVDREGQVHHAAVNLSEAAVDTLGAGDVFNAGIIHALSRDLPVARALEAAVSLAAAQCARDGLVLPQAGLRPGASLE